MPLILSSSVNWEHSHPLRRIPYGSGALTPPRGTPCGRGTHTHPVVREGSATAPGASTACSAAVSVLSSRCCVAVPSALPLWVREVPVEAMVLRPKP